MIVHGGRQIRSYWNMNNVQVTDYTIIDEDGSITCGQKVDGLLKQEWVLHGPLIVVQGPSGLRYVQAMAKIKIHGPPPGMPMMMPIPEGLIRAR